MMRITVGLPDSDMLSGSYLSLSVTRIAFYKKIRIDCGLRKIMKTLAFPQGSESIS